MVVAKTQRRGRDIMAVSGVNNATVSRANFRVSSCPDELYEIVGELVVIYLQFSCLAWYYFWNFPWLGRRFVCSNNELCWLSPISTRLRALVSENSLQNFDVLFVDGWSGVGVQKPTTARPHTIQWARLYCTVFESKGAAARSTLSFTKEVQKKFMLLCRDNISEISVHELPSKICMRFQTMNWKSNMNI